MNDQAPCMRLAKTLKRLEGLDYPATTEEVLSGVGTDAVDLPNGSEQLSEAFGRVAGERYTCPDDACLTLLSALGAEAIGRRRYSDRDPPATGTTEPNPVSF